MRVLRAVARPTGARGLNTSAPTWPLLTREFIRLALYDRERGYFVQRRVIGRPSAPIDFGSLLGKLEYDQLIQRTYRSDENAEAWTTPVELFAPWLSHAIAECVLREFKERQKRPAAKRSKGPGATRRPQVAPTLNLIEIGAGTGSNGIHILDYLRVRAPEVYAATRFTTIEISPTLADAQRARFAAQHARVHRAICADATRLLEAPEVLAMRTDDPVFVVALEVLDNLPHDKVVATKEGWLETVVRPLVRSKHSGDAVPLEDPDLGWDRLAGWREERRPLSDPVLKRTLDELLAFHEASATAPTSAATPEDADSAVARTLPTTAPLLRAAAFVGDALDRARRTLQTTLYAPDERSDHRESDLVVLTPCGPVSRSRGTSKASESAQTAPASDPEPSMRVTPSTSGESLRSSPLGSRGFLPPLRLPATLAAAQRAGASVDGRVASPRAGQHACFVPTGAWQLLHNLHTLFPNHALITSDFNALPPSSCAFDPLPAVGRFRVDDHQAALNEPLVASKDVVARTTQDHGSYLSPDPFGSADIFFATDFVALGRAWASRTGQPAEILRMADFVDRYGNLDRTRTMSGFNPVIETYGNTRFLLVR